MICFQKYEFIASYYNEFKTFLIAFRMVKLGTIFHLHWIIATCLTLILFLLWWSLLIVCFGSSVLFIEFLKKYNMNHAFLCFAPSYSKKIYLLHQCLNQSIEKHISMAINSVPDFVLCLICQVLFKDGMFQWKRLENLIILAKDNVAKMSSNPAYQGNNMYVYHSRLS